MMAYFGQKATGITGIIIEYCPLEGGLEATSGGTDDY